MVKKAVPMIPRPNILTQPNRIAEMPPTGAKKRPHENELKIIPVSIDVQLNSGS